jgi:hypothetical protein
LSAPALGVILERVMTRGVRVRSSIAGAVLVVALAGVACGGSSIRRTQADEDGEGGTAGDSKGGSSGGDGVGGVATGGGTTAGTAGGVATGGTASGRGGSQTGGAPSNDPYPRVEWEGGNGYIRNCPAFAGTHGFLCWHSDGVGSEFCGDGETCNACFCMVPCDGPSGFPECPRGLTGTARPACVHETPTTVGFCGLECDASSSCPDGMTCASYPELPELSIRLCVWLTESG